MEGGGMQFLTIVLVPSETQEILATVTQLVAPYDIERTVPARKEYAPHDELEYLLEVYEPHGLRREDVDAVVAALQEDTGFVCGHDAGGFWYMTTENPQGKWGGWRLHSLQDDSWPPPRRFLKGSILPPSSRPMGPGMIWVRAGT
jgi:hypothetical protein